MTDGLMITGGGPQNDHIDPLVMGYFKALVAENVTVILIFCLLVQ